MKTIATQPLDSTDRSASPPLHLSAESLGNVLSFSLEQCPLTSQRAKFAFACLLRAILIIRLDFWSPTPLVSIQKLIYNVTFTHPSSLFCFLGCPLRQSTADVIKVWPPIIQMIQYALGIIQPHPSTSIPTIYSARLPKCHPVIFRLLRQREILPPSGTERGR